MFFVYVVAPAQSVVSRFAYKEDNSLESVAVQRDTIDLRLRTDGLHSPLFRFEIVTLTSYHDQ